MYPDSSISHNDDDTALYQSTIENISVRFSKGAPSTIIIYSLSKSTSENYGVRYDFNIVNIATLKQDILNKLIVVKDLEGYARLQLNIDYVYADIPTVLMHITDQRGTHNLHIGHGLGYTTPVVLEYSTTGVKGGQVYIYADKSQAYEGILKSTNTGLSNVYIEGRYKLTSSLPSAERIAIDIDTALSSLDIKDTIIDNI